MNYCDVLVYGGTSAGVAAAVQAARMGKKVVLIEQGSMLGGLTSAGLTASDVANYMIIGGLAKEFYERIYNYYQSNEGWKYETHETYMDRVKKRVWGGGDELTKIRWVFEPHVAEKVFNDMIQEAGVKVVYGERMDLKHGVRKEGRRIVSVQMESGNIYEAKVFIDTTYEGDLMACAGISYTFGREANSKYGETLSGVRRIKQDMKVDPHIVPGDRSSGVLPYVEPGIPGEDGEGDQRIQSYTFRMTLTDEPTNLVPIEKPDNYDPMLYELKARQIAAGANPSEFMPVHQVSFTPMPNKKTDTNGADFIGASHAWPDGDYSVRERIWNDHKNYVQGLLWFLGNDPRLPEHARAEMKRWGLAADEYSGNKNWPNNLYVREARRMIGKSVVTQHDMRSSAQIADPIGMCSYTIDCHAVSYFVDEDGNAGREGDIMVGVAPYPVSYQAIVPVEQECENLIVPTALSASHVAFASIRMEPSFMILAQAAGTAASLAADERIAVQDVNYSELRKKLLEDGQILSYDVNPWNEMYADYLVEHNVLDASNLFKNPELTVITARQLLPLFVNTAKILNPSASEELAVQTLKEEGIQPSKEAYWLEAFSGNKEITRASAEQLMRDIARRLSNFIEYPLVGTGEKSAVRK